jgi:hypothetical protein
MKWHSTPPLPGLTRQSILLRKTMDARVKPAHDGAEMQGLRMDRRTFISLLAGAATAAALPFAARAQQGNGTPTIGLLWPADAPPVFPRMESFRQGLRASGLVEGQNVAIELRYAQRGPQQLPDLAAEMVRSKVDVIFAAGDFAARVAQQATSTIPIVTIADDIIGAGLIASLSRPGGNVTGITILAPELSAKRLEILRDIIPGLSRVTALHDPTNGTSQVTMAESAARALNLKLQVLEVNHRDDVVPRAMRKPRRSTSSSRRFSPSCTGRSSPSRRSTVFPQSISGRKMSRPERCYPMASISQRCGGNPQSLRPRFSRAPSLPTCRSSNPRSSSWW